VLPSLVIMLTYGPRPISRAALRNYAKSLPGVPLEQIAIFSDEDATAQLERLLRAAQNQPVLLVHDDVVIRRRSIERLTEVAMRGTQIATPMTNDNECSHSLGPLPEARLAKAALTSAEDSLPAGIRSADRIRPGCLVGRASALYDLLTFRVHDPLTNLTSTGDKMVVVENAVAAHDLACVVRIRSVQPARDETLLVASMIVKDESSMLADCLESLQGIVDRVQICDTGSQDDTIAIAVANGASVIERPWQDDFAWARNECLEECRDARWILWIDADERLIVPDIAFLRSYLTAFGDDLEAITVEIANLSQQGTDKVTSSFHTLRLFRADRSIFVGALHEQVRHRTEQGRELKATSNSLLSIDHLGYTQELVANRDKQSRNVDISRQHYASAPSPKTAMDFARSLDMAKQEPELVVQLLEESAAGTPETDPQAKAYILGFLARILLLEHEQPLAAIDYATEALTFVPSDDVALGVLGQALTETGQHVDLIEFHEAHDFAPSPRPVTFVESARGRYLRNLSLAYFQNGDVESAWKYLLAMAQLDVDLDGEDIAVVVEISRQRGLVQALVSIAPLLDDSKTIDQIIHTVAASTAPRSTSEVCAALLEAGVRSPAAVSTGLLAAVLQDQLAVAAVIAEYSELLEPDIVDRLASKLEQRGNTDLAEQLQAARAVA
jgi:Glycosyl transferase family 2